MLLDAAMTLSADIAYAMDRGMHTRTWETHEKERLEATVDSMHNNQLSYLDTAEDSPHLHAIMS